MALRKKIGITISSLFLLITAVLIQGSTATVLTGEGEGLYKAKCAMCHSADLSGKTPMGNKLKIRDLRSAEVQGQSDAQLYGVIAKGKGKMTAYEKTLSQQQINQLVAFIRERAKH